MTTAPRARGGRKADDPREELFAEERKIRIADEVAAKRKVTVKALSASFRVSGATVRKYLRDLERTGFLIRTHGGAIARNRAGYEPLSKQKEVQNLEAKRRIAQAALGLIEDGDTLLLDTGTTTLELAKCLHARRGLTVVTNDLVIAQRLEENDSFTVVFVGGVVRKGFHCTVGVQGGRAPVDGLTVDKAFMGTNGFSPVKGATTPDIQQAETKRGMIARASQAILLCDHTKFGRVSFAQFAAASQFGCVVTDRIDLAVRASLAKSGVRVLVAPDTHAP